MPYWALTGHDESIDDNGMLGSTPHSEVEQFLSTCRNRVGSLRLGVFDAVR